MEISANQINKFRSCERMIGFHYVEEKKAPPSARQDFGSAVHKQLEGWLAMGVLPDATPAGQVALQGIRHGWLPDPGKLLIEHEFKVELASWLILNGRIDCVRPPKKGDEIPLVVDHKTTSDLKWAMSQDELKKDLQAILYSFWAAIEFQSSQVRCRWIYYAATNPANGRRKPAGAKPVEIVHDVKENYFVDLMSQVYEDCQRIYEIRTKFLKGLQLKPNPKNCSAYGGCFYQDICNLSAEDKLAAVIEKETRK